MNSEDFRKTNEGIKKYAHFDNRVSLKNDEVWKYVTNPNQIRVHAFYPFISFEKLCPKYSHKKNKLKDKKRPLSYSAHIDRCIYQYYAYLINEKYNMRAELDGINECAVAYRNNLHKNNVDFANRAYEFIMKNKECYIIAGDFKEFFNSLNHEYLKERLCDLFGCAQLSDDYYAVFKSITKYSSCMLEDILSYFGLKNRAYEKAEKFRRDQAAQINYAHLSERLDNIKNIMKNLHLPPEKAMEALGIPAADFQKYRSQL